MALVHRDTPAGSDPFRLTLTFPFGVEDMTRTIEDFTDATLQPAFDAARRLPWGMMPSINSSVEQIEMEWPQEGLSGRLVYYYDMPDDQNRVRIDICKNDPDGP